MTATQIMHDLIVLLFVGIGVWALGSYAREEFDRIQRARRIFKGWRRG